MSQNETSGEPHETTPVPEASPDGRMTELTLDEAQLVFTSFDQADAWQLGTLMVERARREQAPVIIDLRRPRLVLFRAALAGATEENEAWLERKSRTVFRYECSTALLAARFEAQGVDVWTAPWFDSTRFTAAGGSFPIRVRGVGVVAAVTVSGLSSDDDHRFAVESIAAYLGRSNPG